MRYGQETSAFKQGDYARALTLYASAGKPPVSLGMDDFESQISPRLQYYLGRTLDAMGRNAEAAEAYRKGIAGVESLSGDRDSWNSDNLFMVASFERLGWAAEGAPLEMRFEDFARGEIDARDSGRRAEARYLLSLAMVRRGRSDEGRKLMQQALEAQPDLIPARLELRGDTLSAAQQTTR